jgi:mutator protein MutT
LGLHTVIPRTLKKPHVKFIVEAAVIVRRGERILLVQRPNHGRWAHMWEFPHTALEEGETHEKAALRLLRDIGVQCQIGPELTTVQHQVTHHRIRMVCLHAQYKHGQCRPTNYGAGRWLEFSQLDGLPISSPHRRLIERLGRAVDS